MASNSLTMKLLINGPSQKVLFAEAGKEVVDFLFSLLAMPLVTIVKLLSKDCMVGCIGKLYQSLEGLEEPYLQSKYGKDALLNPEVTSSTPLPCSLLLPAAPATVAKRYYRCPDQTQDLDGTRVSNSGMVFRTMNFQPSTCKKAYFTSVNGAICPSCNTQMTREIEYVDAKDEKVEAGVGNAVGYVKGVVTYTIMDDLTVIPMSTISSIILLNKFQVKDLSSLEEKTVKLGIDEGLEILKASLQSKAVLSDTFLIKRRRS